MPQFGELIARSSLHVVSKRHLMVVLCFVLMEPNLVHRSCPNTSELLVGEFHEAHTFDELVDVLDVVDF
jgi:hypothetical protein